ncbi:MAG TPA: hypothetical protein PLW93_02420 [Candidatus Absconditabacterales bacterium]|nr:hypothetical protein [Candidatus Absconditabacterales bacterium]HNG97103.1 hypothetical protein [Candidatus Absconditabacterales bacterium]
MNIIQNSIFFYQDHYVADLVIEHEGQTHSIITDGKTLEELL